MVYFVILIASFVLVILANLSARFLKKTIFLNNIYVKKSLLWLLIVPTKKKVLVIPFINYIIQLLLFVIIFVLFIIDWVNRTTIFLDSYWIYIIYLVISISSFALSGSCNKWNY